ncbi:hypothetical protein Tco_0933798 [Tanacetum coccineum]
MTVIDYHKLKSFGGMYHVKNVDYAYLLWEDFVYQVETKNAKKGNEMYYPRFTKVIINFFMTKDPSIPRRNKELNLQKQKQELEGINLILIELLKRSLLKLLKEKRIKATAKQISWKSNDDESEDDEANISIDDEDDDNDDDDDDTDDDDSERTQSDSDGDEFIHPKLTTFDEEETHDEKQDEEVEGSDQRIHTPSQYESTDDEADDEVTQVQQQSSSMSSVFITNMLIPNPDTGIDSVLNVETTSLVDVPVTTQAMITPSFATTLPPPPNPLIIPKKQTPIPTTINSPIPSLQDLPNFGSLFEFDTRLKTLEDNFLEFKQTNQFATTLSSIPNIVDNYLGSKLNDAVDVAVQLKSDKLREDAQTENQDFINNLDAHMQKIIKEQVKAQVKKQVSKILPKLEQSINDQLEAELLTQSSNEAQTSHVIATKLSKLELKKILMDKMEMNKSIDRSTP